jgi:uncharacterized membrane protein
MIFLAVLLVLLSAFLHACKDFFTKCGGDKRVFIWWYEVFAVVFFMPFFVFLFFSGESDSLGVFIGLAVGLVHFLYWVFIGKSYEVGDFSHVYPISRSAPALVLIFSVLFLREEVSLVGVVGIGLTMFGIYVLHMGELSFSAFFGCFRSISSNKSTRLALVTLVLVSVYSIVDKVGVQNMNPFIYSYLLNLSALTLFTPYICSIRDKKEIMCEWTRNWRTIVVNGFITFFGYLLILMAFAIERVSYIVGLRQISIVFGVVMGGHLLNEGRVGVRLTAATIIFIGSMLIILAK